MTLVLQIAYNPNSLYLTSGLRRWFAIDTGAMKKFYLFPLLMLGLNFPVDIGAKEVAPMTTERPSKTDSAFSVPAGLMQIESNFYSYTQDNRCSDSQCQKSRQQSFGEITNVRIGISENADIQIIGDLYSRLDTNSNGEKQTQRGYSDTQVRLKVNLLGNTPEASYSIALLPYLKLPTHHKTLGTNNAEGGIGLPFNINMNGWFALSGMTQLNIVRSQARPSYDLALANSLMLSRNITSKLGSYIEYYTYKVNALNFSRENYVDAGFIYEFTPSFRMDINGHFGVNQAAVDSSIFVGGAYRF